MKKVLRFWPALIVLGLIVFATINYHSYPQRSERLLDRFADPKEHYAMLLDGYVHHEGDTVFFELLPAVQFKLSSSDRDVITIKKASGESTKFTRYMVNMWNIPNPCGDGKAMEGWRGDENFFDTFEKVVENGQIVYDWFGTEAKLTQNFIQTYDKDTATATRLAKKVSDPLFSERRLGEGSGNLVRLN